MRVILGVNRTTNFIFNRNLLSLFRLAGDYSKVRTQYNLMKFSNKKNILLKNSKMFEHSVKKFDVDCDSEESTFTRIERITKNLSETYAVTFLDTPLKPKTDTKEYLVMKLTNGLTALLISDVKYLMDSSEFISDIKTQKEISEYGIKQLNNMDAKQNEKLAACSLSVDVGSFDDPENVAGLAHLLEHMLFMGSEKYPDENDFNSFVTARGGSNNAATDSQCTTYFFDCPEIHMEETLDRFANFFISPLMRRESISRETQIIESEFQMHSKSDSLRTQQIIANTATKENPIHKFMWGNLKTLKDSVSEDELYNALRDFQKTYYSASRMMVAIQARLPLSTLGRWVAEHFGNIASDGTTRTPLLPFDSPFKVNEFNRMYTVMPVSDINLLKLTWILPPVQHLYKSKPTLYPSFMINNEGQGSLASYLKNHLYALNVIGGVGNEGNDNNSAFSMFHIAVLLTEKGIENIDKVLYAVFSFIKMMKTAQPCDRIFNEIKFLAETNFNFAPDSPSMDYVQYLSQCMRLFPPVDYLAGNGLLYECVPEDVTYIMDHLGPVNVNIMLISKTAADGVVLNNTEQWFGAKYNMIDIPEDWEDEWKDCDLTSEFFLPPPNTFIPSNFEILEVEGKSPIYPEKIISDKHIELWFKQDAKFRLPFGYIKINMISPYSMSLPESFVMCDLFVALFSVLYDGEIYPATIAGLMYVLSPADCGLSLSVTGYNEKLPTFLEMIIDLISSIDKNLTSGIFDAVKEVQRKVYYNDVLNPTSLARELRLSLLCEPYCTSITKLEAISEVDMKKFEQFCVMFFGSLYIKCLIQGNLSKKQALDISDMLRLKLNYSPLLLKSHPKIKVRQLPKGEKVLRVKSLSEEDINCHVTNYYQCGLCEDIRESCMIELLMMNIAEPLFDTLRTKEQLGYYVTNDFRNTFGVLGFTVAVKFQADKFNIQHVENRMSEFLQRMKVDLKKLSVEDFNRLKMSAKMLKLQEDSNLDEEVDRNWLEIESDEYLFDRVKKEIHHIDSLKLQDLYDYFNKIMSENKSQLLNNRCLRKLSVQVDASYGGSIKTPHPMKAIQNLNHELQIVSDENGKLRDKFIKDTDNFQSSMYIYPNINKL